MSLAAARNASHILFQNSFTDVVRKIRNSKRNEREAIESCIEEIKKEVCSPLEVVKCTAVVKLMYFAMLGYQIDYAAFNIIEVMANTNFEYKRVGYTAAALTFREDTDVLPLCTALLRRDLFSNNMYEVGLALYFLSNVCTPSLAQDFVTDVSNLLSHPNGYMRKKAVLCLYKMILQYPEALRQVYSRIKDKIEDSDDHKDQDPSVRAAVVSIFCEMSRRNPQNFMNLAVPFYSLLSTVHNNWTLIKVIKTFGYFSPYEPRLGKKLAEPLTMLMNTTAAKSVQFECILAVTNGMSQMSQLMKLAVEKMKLFVKDSDQNLKCLGFDAMSRVVGENGKLLADQRDNILECLNNNDMTIRRKALKILHQLVTPKNIVFTINKMFDASIRTPPNEDWTNLVIKVIIETVKMDDYINLTDFDWYIGVLIDLSSIELTRFRYGADIEKEVVTVLNRVSGVRSYGVESLSVLLINESLLKNSSCTSTQWHIMKAAAFVCGEYPHYIPYIPGIVKTLLSDYIAHYMPIDLQLVCIQAVIKIFAYCLRPCQRHINLHDEEEIQIPKEAPSLAEMKLVILSTCQPSVHQHWKKEGKEQLHGIDLFYHSPYPEVQQSAQFLRFFVESEDNEEKIAASLEAFLGRELVAVANDAQLAVEVPDGLNLDEPFGNDLAAYMQAERECGITESSDNDEEDEKECQGSDGSSGEEEAAEEARRKETQRRDEMAVFYIKEGDDKKYEDKEEDMDEEKTLKGRRGKSGVTKQDENEKLSMEEEDEQKGKKQLPLQMRAVAASNKKYTISRDMAKPANYVNHECEKKDWRSRSPEEDEATKRLRAINVSLGEDALNAKRFRKKNFGDLNALNENQTVVFKDKTVYVVMKFMSCKAKKSGFNLGVLCAVTNLSHYRSVTDVTVNAKVSLAKKSSYHDDSECSAMVGYVLKNDLDQKRNINKTTSNTITGTKISSNKSPKNAAVEVAKDDAAAARNVSGITISSWEEKSENFRVAEKIKSTATHSREFVIEIPFDKVSPRLFDTALEFRLSCTYEAKKREFPLELPLRFSYFVAEFFSSGKNNKVVSIPSSAEFRDVIVADKLSDAPALVADIDIFLPSSKRKSKQTLDKEENKDDFSIASAEKLMLAVLQNINASLRTHVIDVFTDTCTIYTQLVSRKSYAKKSHVAILLQYSGSGVSSSSSSQPHQTSPAKVEIPSHSTGSKEVADTKENEEDTDNRECSSSKLVAVSSEIAKKPQLVDQHSANEGNCVKSTNKQKCALKVVIKAHDITFAGAVLDEIENIVCKLS